MSASTAEPAATPVKPAEQTSVPSQTAVPVENTNAASSNGTPLTQLASKLGPLLEETGYHEMYGVELQPWTQGIDIPVPQQVILQKFLRANAGDVAKAAQQLQGALVWRKEYEPLKAVDEVFDRSKFDGLGYVAKLKDIPGSPNTTDIAVFNIYGAVKDNSKTFGDLDSFLRWRVALMEMTIAALRLPDATTPLPDYGIGPDPYQAVQVHDYLSVSFLRQAPEVKAASSKTIQLFQAMYPETVSKKFFVNVPRVMQWMFAAMQLFMAKETIAKMKWMAYGSYLYQDLGPGVPKVYGGDGPELAKSASTPKYGDATATTAEAKPSKTEPAEPTTRAVPAATATNGETEATGAPVS